MKKLVFNCKFITEVVLNANTATEGSQTVLDYIPGSNFLGIVAKEYSTLGNDKAYQLFHSGNVQFGDGHIIMGTGNNKTRSLKTPFSWYTKKAITSSGRQEYYVHHKISDEIKKTQQLKQEREGFFIVENNTIYRTLLENNYHQKSAQERLTRRSANEKMFGYEALNSGTEWQFFIHIKGNNNNLAQDIISILEGRNHIGRSKTAQFGIVEIKHVNQEVVSAVKIKDKSFIELYAESNLCFFNDYGYPTTQPTNKLLGLPDGCSIDYEKSQIRTLSYAPWNNRRSARDSDRICIAKGSVLVVNTNGIEIDTSTLLEGVGSYTNEGLGRVIVNPSFLENDEDGILLKEIKNNKSNANKPEFILDGSSAGLSEEEDTIIWLVKERANKQKQETEAIKLTYDFFKKYNNIFKGLSASQWGGIRNIANQSGNYNDMIEELFGKNNGEKDAYLMHGVIKEQWDKNGRREKLYEFLEKVNKSKKCDPVDLTILLSSYMAKKASNK